VTNRPYNCYRANPDVSQAINQSRCAYKFGFSRSLSCVEKLTAYDVVNCFGINSFKRTHHAQFYILVELICPYILFILCAILACVCVFFMEVWDLRVLLAFLSSTNQSFMRVVLHPSLL